MPSIAKTLGLILVVATPACLAAQTYSSGNPSYHAAGVPPPLEAYPAPSVATGYGNADVVQTVQTPIQTPVQTPIQTPVQTPSDTSAAIPLSLPSDAPPLPLSPPERATDNRPTGSNPLASGVTVLGSLAVVLGAFFLVAWCMRRSAPAGSIALPGEVFEVLGRGAMAGRQQVYLLRCGKKLILVSVTPAGAETLTEITDSIEVDRLSGICEQSRPSSATAAFRQVFGQFARQQQTEADYTEPEHSALADRGDARVLRTSTGLENRDG